MFRALFTHQPLLSRALASRGAVSLAARRQLASLGTEIGPTSVFATRAFSGCPFHQGAGKSTVFGVSSTASTTTTASPTTAPSAAMSSSSSSSSPSSSAAAYTKPKPLTPEQIAIVKSTVPLLETGGEALTKHFYTLLMQNTEVRPLFNQTHQASGAQPRALAFSVLCYARNIDALENLGPLAAQIVHKHVSFQVMPEHYPIVGGCLLRAIREVLGANVATDAVIDAWAAAYFQLADILISAEAQLYEQIASAPGGWRSAREFRVARKVPASQDGTIMSFELAPVDGGAVLNYAPGQYIGLHISAPGMAESARRNYSLSRAADAQSLRITVKKHPGGVVSTHLHDNVKEGDTLHVFPPAGEFVLDSTHSRPVVFLSAGVGITPTMAMLQAATAPSAPERPIAFAHYNQHSGVQAFADDVAAIARQQRNVSLFTAFEEPPAQSSLPGKLLHGRVSKEHLQEVIGAVGEAGDVDVYVLGPTGFMKQSKELLLELGVPRQNIKYEFFGPAEQI